MMTIGTFILRLTIGMMTILGFEDTADNHANSENEIDNDNQDNDDENDDAHDDERYFRVDSLEFHRLVALFHCFDSGLPGFFMVLMLMLMLMLTMAIRTEYPKKGPFQQVTDSMKEGIQEYA